MTKRGSDKFAVDTSFYFNHQKLSSGSRAGTQLYEGRLLDQSDPRPPNAQYQFNLNVSGPIVKQKQMCIRDRSSATIRLHDLGSGPV